MKRHPEQRDGEVFLGNFTIQGYATVGRLQKRMGKVAYMADGSQMDKHSQAKLSPVFCAPDPKLDKH